MALPCTREGTRPLNHMDWFLGNRAASSPINGYDGSALFPRNQSKWVKGTRSLAGWRGLESLLGFGAKPQPCLYSGNPSLLSHSFPISVLEGSDSSTSLRAVSMPAIGRPVGSSLPICTSTEA